jgi:hypothetical protein
VPDKKVKDESKTDFITGYHSIAATSLLQQTV